MLNAFSDLLCSKLCRHNRPAPTCNDYRHYSLVFLHGHHVHMYMYRNVLRTQDPLQYMCIKNLVSYDWSDPFLAQDVYHLQYRFPAMPIAMIVYAT